MANSVSRKRVKWEFGDIFAVPLTDGSFGACQAAYDVMPHVVDCAFFSLRFHTLPVQAPAVTPEDVIALLAVWKNPLKNGSWPKIGHASPVLPASSFPNQLLIQKANGVGVKHSNEPLIEGFLSAWHALQPWNTLYEEDYYDKLLAPGVVRPANAVILDARARAEWRDREARELEAKRAALKPCPKRT